MKVLVLGAAGKAGRAVVLSLSGISGIERIFLADNQAEALTKLASDLGHLPVSTRFLDADNDRSLSERMTEADLVIGCLGPFHLYEGRIVEAAIATRRDYISMCDDPVALREALSQSADAESNGVRVLSGCGLAPGLSNLLACRACSRLDRVDSLGIAWYLEMGDGLGTATVEHFLHSFSGKSACHHEGGREAKSRAGSWEEYVEFPPPVGWQVVGFLGHPEPVTLPYAVGGVSSAYFKAGVGNRRRNLALQSLAWLGEEGMAEPWVTALHAAAGGIVRRGGGRCLSALRVTAKGWRMEVEKSVVRAVVGDYYRVSSQVLVAAVEDWMKSRWPAGVHTPERILDNRDFFARLHSRGVRFLVGEERSDGNGMDARPVLA
jgi:Saccharopine dehydrogenase NADP binding domain